MEKVIRMQQTLLLASKGHSSDRIRTHVSPLNNNFQNYSFNLPKIKKALKISQNGQLTPISFPRKLSQKISKYLRILINCGTMLLRVLLLLLLLLLLFNFDSLN